MISDVSNWCGLVKPSGLVRQVTAIVAIFPYDVAPGSFDDDYDLYTACLLTLLCKIKSGDYVPNHRPER